MAKIVEVCRARCAYGIVLATLLTLATGSAAQADELRGFWVDTWGAGILSQTQVDTLLGVVGDGNSLGQIREAHCNAVFVEVRRRADACYPSTMGEPYMSGLSPYDFNALQAVINAAHDTTNGKQRIEVHAWMVAFATSTDGGTPSSVYYAHNTISDTENYWPTLSDAGEETGDKAFDPGHPRCEEYLTDVSMDVVNNYDVDGIHFDYIRFTANNQGYNPTSIARYNARYGLTGQPASSDEQFKQWRRDQVTNFVRRVYAHVQASKPQVKVSAAGVTWNPSPATSTRAAFQGTRPYYDVYSDWDAWMEEGILDMSVPMTYYDNASLPTDYTKWMNFQKDRKFNRHNIVGPGIYLNSLSNAITQLLATRDATSAGNYAQGFCGYSYRTPYTSGTWDGFSPTLIAQVTPTQANIPDMPWKSAPTLGHIMGTVSYYGSGVWADGATVSITGPVSRSMLCDGTGFYAFIDVQPGSYTITVSQSGYPDITGTTTVTAGQMSTKNFVLGSNPPPVISNVQATNLTTTTATITWTTDVNATSQVNYGTTTAYGTTTPLDSTAVKSHTVNLTDLTPGTVYHYQVLSTNSNGTSTSADYTFITDGAPIISDVQATAITDSSATITWTTHSASDSQVQYGTTTAYGNQTPVDTTLVTSHSLTLTGLTANTLYHYQVISANAYGSTSGTDCTFTTIGAPTIETVQVVNIGANSATITWSTDNIADSQVRYGTSSSYDSQTPVNTTLVTSHSLTLTGLTASTLYHYQVVSTNAYGSDTSDDLTFTTSDPITEIIVDNTDAGWSNLRGTWMSSTNGSPYIGSDYIWSANNRSRTTARCQWTPTLPVSGPYDVYAHVVTGTNRTTNAPFTIYYDSGNTTVYLNEYSSPASGGWFLLASGLTFAAGSNGYVQLSNKTGETTDSTAVCGDAIKFVYQGAINDTEAPSVPTNVAASALSSSTMRISWSASTDNVSVAGYRVFRDGVYIASTSATTCTDVLGLSPNTTYSYTVSAYDNVPNESAQSTAATRTTLSQPPTTANITCDQPTNTWFTTETTFTFSAVGDFGPGTVTKYRAAWDTQPTHTYGSTGEFDWTSNPLPLTVTPGQWYLHVMGYNSEGVSNGTLDLGPYQFDNTPPTAPVVTPTLSYIASTTSVSATWTVEDAESGIQNSEYRIIDQAGPVLRDWTSTGTSTSVNATGLTFQMGHTYLIQVRSTNVVGLLGEVGSSDPLPVLLFDTNHDTHIDANDLVSLRACMSAEGKAYPTGLSVNCSYFDTDTDGDVDLGDFGVFQRCLTGSQAAIDANCLKQ